MPLIVKDGVKTIPLPEPPPETDILLSYIITANDGVKHRVEFTYSLTRTYYKKFRYMWE